LTELILKLLVNSLDGRTELIQLVVRIHERLSLLIGTQIIRLRSNGSLPWDAVHALSLEHAGVLIWNGLLIQQGVRCVWSGPSRLL
jgi:hypothetical protein